MVPAVSVRGRVLSIIVALLAERAASSNSRKLDDEENMRGVFSSSQNKKSFRFLEIFFFKALPGGHRVGGQSAEGNGSTGDPNQTCFLALPQLLLRPQKNAFVAQRGQCSNVLCKGIPGGVTK